MSGNNGVTVNSGVWAAAGAEFLIMSNLLMGSAAELDLHLSNAGQAWGQDDLGRIFASGGAGKPGFETTLNEVWSQLADMVNALQYAGEAITSTNGTFAQTELAVSKAAASPDATPADVEAAVSKAAKGVKLAVTFRPPPIRWGAVQNDKPPASWMPIVDLLEQLTPYRVPDGSQAGLDAIAKALNTMSNTIATVSEDVRSTASRVIAANVGQAASSFAGFASQLTAALQWLAEAGRGLSMSAESLLLLKEAAWQQLSQAVTFLSSQEATLTAQAQSNMSAAEAGFTTVVREEGQALVAARKTLDSEVLAGLPATPTSPVTVWQGQAAAADQRAAAPFG